MNPVVNPSGAEITASDTEHLSWIQRANATGQTRARNIRDKYGTNNPFQIAIEEDIEINQDHWNGFDSVQLLGAYSGGAITLYEGQIDRVANIADIDRNILRKAVCSHELAHYLLEQNPPEWREQYSPIKRALRWLRRKKTSRPSRRSLEECAAHSFATTLIPESVASFAQQSQ
ncbi:hypothetical protein [Haladaptatus caseinilyticus]|uniref:hypothetical protein n=1 Tax=Haladaptatus caseinilyticus TaxID=2993314 RepID=UPI00224B83BB|nr:hypothetical protein [Haladaptatus caseinilyticus]